MRWSHDVRLHLPRGDLRARERQIVLSRREPEQMPFADLYELPESLPDKRHQDRFSLGKKTLFRMNPMKGTSIKIRSGLINSWSGWTWRKTSDCPLLSNHRGLKDAELIF